MSTVHEHEPFDRANPARFAASLRVAIVNLASNLALTVAQVLVGIAGHSQALIADGLHTLSDMLADILVLFALSHGRKGADADHPYGHERIETAVTMVLGAILFAVGVGIAVRAGLRLLSTEAIVTPSALTLWVALGTLAAKEAMYRYTMRTATRFDSNMLRASAWHHRSDAASSLIVAAGIGGSLIGFAYLDLVAAIVVAALIGKIGIQLARQALRELVDTGVEAPELEAIQYAIRHVSGVRALHLLRTRRIGGRVLVDVHVQVDERISVSEGHQIGETVRATLIREFPTIADVMVHIDTEDDMEGTADNGLLPLRGEVQKRLAKYLRDIPEAAKAERTTLHFRNDGIEVELLLPLSLAPNPEAAHKLGLRISEAVRSDPLIKSVSVSFLG